MSERRGRRSSSSTTSPRTCACSRRCSLRAATTSSPRATASRRSSSSSRSEPDLILLDVMMPGLDGYAVCTPAAGERRDRGAAGDHGHLEHRPGEDEGDRGRRGRLHPEAVQPRRAAHARPVAAPHQALPRHDQGAGGGARRAEPDARGAGRGAGRRSSSGCGGCGDSSRRSSPSRSSPRATSRFSGATAGGGGVLRRSARLDELRRRASSPRS